MTSLQFTRRDLLIALLIIALAFGYRLWIILDRAYAPSSISAFDPLPAGTDQAVYHASIAGFRAGEFPPPTYFYQPGMSWFMIAISALMRTDNPGALRVLVAVLAAVNIGFFMAAVRLAFRDRKVAVIAGVLLAVYPVSAFYDTDFVITSQAVILVTLMLLSVMWLWRYPKHWVVAALLGLCVGGAALTRFEAAAVGLALALWLLWARRDRGVGAWLQMALAGVVALGVISPVILHNRAGGADYLITPMGSAEVYRGNNRDTDGTHGGRQASATTGYDYLYFLAQDIALNPRRFMELTARKAGLLLSASEPGNNLNYVISGVEVSPALRWNPLDFRWLLAAALVGLYAALRAGQDARRAALALTAGALALLAMTLLIWVEARIRTPVIILLIPLAAFGIVTLVRALRQANAAYRWRRRDLWLAPFIVLLFALSWLAETRLPRPNFIAAPPQDLVPAGLIYDDTLRLIGWRVQPNYSPPGTIQPFRPYVVSLYWELLADTEIDYSFSLAFLVDGEPLIAFDHPIGVVAYPDTPTSAWPQGAQFAEHIGLTWRSFEGPVEISGDLLLYVYPNREAEKLLVPAGLASPSVRIDQPAIIWDSGRFETLDAAREPAAAFADLFYLRDYWLPETGTPGAEVDVVLGWQTRHDPIERSYAIAVSLFDEQDMFVATFDGPPRDGRLLTSSLPAHYLLEDRRRIRLPEAPGTYRVYVALYDYETLARLPLPGSESGLYPLGAIVVQ
ncbi:MAG: hypothetical protein SNJ59_15010 [Aggregatilineales bacterium]